VPIDPCDIFVAGACTIQYNITLSQVFAFCRIWNLLQEL